MKHKPDAGMLFLTFLTGAAGMTVWYLLFIEYDFCSEWKPLAMGVYFALCPVMGLLGLFAAELLKKKRFRVVRLGNRMLFLLLAPALGMGIGAGGQALYALTWQKDTAVDIVLLLDQSGSMEYNWDSCSKVACEFIDLAEDTSRIQTAAFETSVSEGTGLLLMDETGKEKAKEYIQQIRPYGGTNFKGALQKAVNDLRQVKDRDGRKQAVVMVTDGKPEDGNEIQLGSKILESFQQDGIAFYSIQIYNSGDLSSSMDGLTDFAGATGGFDTRLERDTAGKIGIQEMKKAFDEAYAGARGLSQEDVWLGFGAATENIVWRFAVRLLAFAVFAALTGFAYYQRQTRFQVLANAAAGCLTAILITMTGNLSEEDAIPAAMFLTNLFVVSAWASCSPSETMARDTD